MEIRLVHGDPVKATGVKFRDEWIIAELTDGVRKENQRYIPRENVEQIVRTRSNPGRLVWGDDDV